MIHTLQRKESKRARSGFTLIELMMGIVIIGVITGGVVYTIMTVMENARFSSTKTTIQLLKSAVAQYEQNKGEYPKSLQDVKAAGFLPKGNIPLDGWKRKFIYRETPGENAKHPFELYSQGPNPKEKASRIDAWTAR